MMIPVAWFTNSQFGLEKSAQDEFAAAIRNWKLPSNNGLGAADADLL
jgi:hypothetical protein